jgi:hypothetical protein
MAVAKTAKLTTKTEAHQMAGTAFVEYYSEVLSLHHDAPGAAVFSAMVVVVTTMTAMATMTTMVVMVVMVVVVMMAASASRVCPYFRRLLLLKQLD